MQFPYAVDYSTRKPDVNQLARLGYQACIRYVWDDGEGKGLTRDEAVDICAHNMLVVSVFESTADRYRGGWPAGRDDALSADSYHRRCGGPNTAPIYFAVDEERANDRLDLVDSYFRGVGAWLDVERIGVYGSYDVVKYCADNKLASRYWQTPAWSRGRWFTATHLRQIVNGAVRAGGLVDIDQVTAKEYGGWTVTDMVQVPSGEEIWTYRGPAIHNLKPAGVCLSDTADRVYTMANSQIPALRQDIVDVRTAVEGVDTDIAERIATQLLHDDMFLGALATALSVAMLSRGLADALAVSLLAKLRDQLGK